MQLPPPQVRRWATAHLAQHPKDFTRALPLAFGVTRAAAGPSRFIEADLAMAGLELSKGRVTTDPDKHGGEGTFLTSRAFSVFRVLANGLAYERRNRDLDLAEPSALQSAV